MLSQRSAGTLTLRQYHHHLRFWIAWGYSIIGCSGEAIEGYRKPACCTQTELANINAQRAPKQIELDSVSDSVARKHTLAGEICELNNRRTAVSQQLDSKDVQIRG